MKLFTLFTALSLCGFATSAFTSPLAAQTNEQNSQEKIVWMTDFEAAKALAQAESKPLFLSFTGSDWCGWCMKLEKEILSTPEFQSALAQKVIFVHVDFPKKSLPAALKAQNDALAKKYNVRGFPTIIILDDHLNTLGTLGYKAGGPAPFIKSVEEIINAH